MSTTAPDRVDELEEALVAPRARRRDPFVHIFYPPLWRLLSRTAIRAGDVALCGFVAHRPERGEPLGRKSTPVCPRCEVLHGGSRWRW